MILSSFGSKLLHSWGRGELLIAPRMVQGGLPWRVMGGWIAEIVPPYGANYMYCLANYHSTLKGMPPHAHTYTHKHKQA